MTTILEGEKGRPVFTDEEKKTVGERIKQIRKHVSAKTQQAFADACSFNRAYLASLESGKQFPSSNIMMQLKNTFNVSIDWLLTGEGNMFLSKDKDSAVEAKEPSFYPISGLRLRHALPEEEEAEYQAACQALERDDLIRKIVLTLEDMPLEKRREVLSIAEEKKLLSQLMKERAAQKPGATF